MRAHIKYTTPYALSHDFNYYAIQNDDAAFGYFANVNANGHYFFGGYNENTGMVLSGSVDGDPVYQEIAYDTQYNINNICDFLTTCKNYIVNVEGQMSSDKYDTMIEGVRAYGVGENYKAYAGAPVLFWGFGATGLEIDVMAGTEGLHATAEAAGFHNVAVVVNNIFITAYEDYNQNNDDIGAFFAFDAVKKAVELNYIDDPDIKQWIDDNEWEYIEDSRCDWTINIDGNKDPEFTIAWSAPMIEGGDVDGGNATVTIMIDAYQGGIFTQRQILGIYSYMDHTKKFSFSKLATEANIPEWQQFLANLVRDCQVKIYMYVTYFIPGTHEDVTSTAQATLTYKGQGTGKILPPLDGSTITFNHGSTDEFITQFEDDIDAPDTPDGTSPESKQQTYSGIGVMTRTYVIDKGRLQQLGRKLWDYSFYDFIQNLNASPIENIVSIKMYPFVIPGGADTEIVLGNVGMGVMGKPVDIDYNCKHVINPSGTTIAKKYPQKYNYLNSNFFTKLSIFLPYIGFKELDASVFLDHELKVEYIVDILTGSCVAMCYADDIPIVQYNGLMGLDIPISATNRAQVEAGIVQSVGQTAMQLAQKDLGGAANAALNILSQSYHTETKGTASPSCNSFITHDVFYILEAPEVQFPSGYAHAHGLPLFLTKSLNKVHGFTVCDNVDTSGIQGATLEEKEMIKQALMEGVYL